MFIGAILGDIHKIWFTGPGTLVDMQIIYAVPFILVSLTAFSLCLAIPRLRAYAFSALVAPVAFGGCSIFGLALFMLGVDTIYDSLPRVVAIAAPLLTYLVSGCVGAWLAIRVGRFLKHRFGQK